MTRRHTDQELEEAGRRFDQLADEFDPDTADVDYTADLRSIADAVDVLRADEERLQAAVNAARSLGRSWNQIAVPLGVSRQAARQRFGEKTSA